MKAMNIKKGGYVLKEMMNKKVRIWFKERDSESDKEVFLLGADEIGVYYRTMDFHPEGQRYLGRTLVFLPYTSVVRIVDMGKFEMFKDPID